MVTKKKTPARTATASAGNVISNNTVVNTDANPLYGKQAGGRMPYKRPIPDEVFAAAERQGGRVRVKAKEMIWYGINRWRAGDVFVILKPEHFSTKSMELVDDRVPLRRTLGKAELAKQHADIMRGKSPRLQANAADLEVTEGETSDSSERGEAVVSPPDAESPLE